VCVNGKGVSIGKGITIVISASMDAVMIHCDIVLVLQNHIDWAVMVSLSIAGYYQRVFLS